MLKTNKSLLKDPELLDLTCVGERGGRTGCLGNGCMVSWGGSGSGEGGTKRLEALLE